MLEKTTNIIWSNYRPVATMPTKPCPCLMTMTEQGIDSVQSSPLALKPVFSWNLEQEAGQYYGITETFEFYRNT